MVRILHLTLKRKWFDLIAAGKKKVEYREMKPYWNKRLSREYDEIHFRNGYSKDCPFMRIEYKGKGEEMFEGKRCYAIKLGRILEIKNHR